MLAYKLQEKNRSFHKFKNLKSTFLKKISQCQNCGNLQFWLKFKCQYRKLIKIEKDKAALKSGYLADRLAISGHVMKNTLKITD